MSTIDRIILYTLLGISNIAAIALAIWFTIWASQLFEKLEKLK